MTFDEYCRAVREANVSFVLSRREESRWGLDYAAGKGLTIQLGSDGAASVADGIARDDAFIVMCRHSPSRAKISMNGARVGDHDFIVLPPASHFIFAADAPRSWVAISVPLTAQSASRYGECDRSCPGLAGRPGVVASGHDAHERFLAVVGELRRGLSGRAPDEPADMIEDRLVSKCQDIIAVWQDSRRSKADQHNYDALDHVGRALQALRDERFRERWYVKDLAQAAGVGTRTLLRSFHQIVGMGPVRYLRLRQLNLIRMELVSSATRRTSVTRAMRDAGATELGRVAGAYKALFGELPSETLRKALVRKGDARDAALARIAEVAVDVLPASDREGA